MKRQMINHEQLPFPSGIAAAETLRSLYSGSAEAVQKAYVLIAGLGVGALVAVLRTGEGTFKFLDRLWGAVGPSLPWCDKGDGPIPGQLPHEGFFKVNGKQLIGFGVDTSVLLMAAGMIVGMRVSLSMLAGSCLLYFVVGPYLIQMDAANAGKEGYIQSIEIVGGGQVYHMFRWGLWGGTSLMVISSLTTLWRCGAHGPACVHGCARWRGEQG
jgi:uncharacterized oligopeptide transporter (OPT) family protein